MRVSILITPRHHYADRIDKMAAAVYSSVFSPFIMSTGNQNLTQQVLSLSVSGDSPALYTVCDRPTLLDHDAVSPHCSA